MKHTIEINAVPHETILKAAQHIHDLGHRIYTKCQDEGNYQQALHNQMSAAHELDGLKTLMCYDHSESGDKVREQLRDIWTAIHDWA